MAPIQSVEDLDTTIRSLHRIPSVESSSTPSLTTILMNNESATNCDSSRATNCCSKQLPSSVLRQRLDAQLSESFEKCIVDCVLSDLISVDVGVTFDNIASLSDAKRILHEAIVLPTIVPEFFTGIREPWKVQFFETIPFCILKFFYFLFQLYLGNIAVRSTGYRQGTCNVDFEIYCRFHSVCF
jgi:hypothetical protein